MAELYNVQTRKREQLADDQVEQAVAGGTHSFKVGESVDVLSPDGERGTLPAENLQKALGSGYKIQTATQKAVGDYVDENQGLKGAAKVALGQFADEALMGLPELILNRTQDPLEVAKREALKKEHAVANAVGGLAGFGASMAVPGLNYAFKGATRAGEAVAANLAEKLLASSAGEIGTRTASKIAKEIVAKMAVSNSNAW
jgi:hypothetical protein